MQEITRVAVDSKGAKIKTTTGASFRSYTRNRDHNENLCIGQFYGSGVTVFFVNSKGTVTDKYVHIGWDYDTDSPYFGFTITDEAWSDGLWLGNTCYGGCQSQYSCAVPNNLFQFRVNNVTGTDTWKTWARCDGESTWHILSTWAKTGYTKGIATSTTYRWEPDYTGMSDAFDQLQYRDASGNWTDWPGNAKFLDNAPGWTASNIHATLYSVIKG